MFKTDTKNEIKALTGLRGIASVYVVVHHTMADGSNKNLFQLFTSHGYLSVDVFLS